jgi:general secretion pathway protein K
MSAKPARSRRDGGYALVAAVTSVTAFAYIAFQVLAADEGGIAAVAARVEQAKLSASADAGVALAVHALAAEDRGARWSLDGRPHEIEFAGDDLTIVLEDERGKAPLQGLNDAQVRSLFAGAGATGDRLTALVTEFRDWQTEPESGSDIQATPDGSPVRHGPIRTLGELAALKDMDPTLLARMAPAVTLFFEENGPFVPEHASRLALATMRADLDLEEGAADQAVRGPDAPIQRPEEDLAADDDLRGHTLTVRVTARAPTGAQTHRMAIIELTGDSHQPYWVRYVE